MNYLSKNKTDRNTSVEELRKAFAAFRHDRDWESYHTSRNLAISIAVEAAELMEHFQWGEPGPEKREAIADELADVTNYCLSFADAMAIDITQAFRHKLEKVQSKYPIGDARPEDKHTA